jgi:predicted dehydrogenase
VPDKYEIVAVADELSERRDEAKREFGCRTHKDYRDLIADGDFDLFVNALPTHLHPEATIAALEAGLNVVCEKPLAVKVSDFDAMVAAVEKSGKVFAPFQNARFFPYFRKIMEVVDSGVLGEIVHVRLNWSKYARRWDWQTKQEFWGGALNDTAPHPLDHALMLFGPKKPKVFCVLKSGDHTYGDADDFCAVTLHGEDSPTVEVFVSYYQGYRGGNVCMVNGTRGSLIGGIGAVEGVQWKYFKWEDAEEHELHTGWSHNREFPHEDLPWVEESWVDPTPDPDLFQQMSEVFYDNVYDVLTGRGQLIVTHEQVRRLTAVLQECHRMNPLPKRKE